MQNAKRGRFLPALFQRRGAGGEAPPPHPAGRGLQVPPRRRAACAGTSFCSAGTEARKAAVRFCAFGRLNRRLLRGGKSTAGDFRGAAGAKLSKAGRPVKPWKFILLFVKSVLTVPVVENSVENVKKQAVYCGFSSGGNCAPPLTPAGVFQYRGLNPLYVSGRPRPAFSQEGSRVVSHQTARSMESLEFPQSASSPALR